MNLLARFSQMLHIIQSAAKYGNAQSQEIENRI